MSRLTNIIAACCFFLVSLSALVSAQEQSSLYADTSCNSNLCLKVIYSPSEKRYNMTMSANGGGAPLGWYSVGTGSKMDGSNMMIGWVDTAGNVVMSQRTASGHVNPTTTISAAAANIETHHSFSNSSGTAWVWSFPLSSADTPSKSTSFIWALNKNDNPASSSTSSIKRHTAYGSMSLDLTKPYNAAASSSSGSAGTVTPATANSNQQSQQKANRVLNMSNRMIIAHMVLMIVAWLILIPAGILIGRFGRTFFAWFPYHRGIQAFAAVLVIIAFIIIVVEVGKGGGGHFTNKHGQTGLAIFIILFVQAALGMVGHRLKRFNVTRIVHVVLGLGVTTLAAWNATTGMNMWQWNPPAYASWILWIWFGVLALVYLAGLALLPRDIKQWKASKEATDEKQGFHGLQHNASPGYSSPGHSVQQPSPGESNRTHPGWGAPPLQTQPQGYESYSPTQPTQPLPQTYEHGGSRA